MEHHKQHFLDINFNTISGSYELKITEGISYYGNNMERDINYWKCYPDLNSVGRDVQEEIVLIRCREMFIACGEFTVFRKSTQTVNALETENISSFSS
jgi:hypothetical protein